MNGDKTVITITTGTIIRIFLFLLIGWAVYFLRDTVLAVLAAIVISSAIDPGVRWFEKRKIPRTLGVVLIFLGVIILVGFVLFFIIPTFLVETSNLISNIPDYINQINNSVPLLDQSILEGYAPLLKNLAERISHASFVTNLSDGSFMSSSAVFNSTTSLAGGALTFILIIVLSFYFSVTRDGVSHFLRIITPLKHEDYIIDLWDRTKLKIGAWMQGQIFLGALVGSIIFMILSIFHAKHALPLGILMGIMEIIPVFGPTLAAIPGVILALLDGGIGFGITILLVYVIVQQFESNIFYPLVVKKMVGISPILVMISLVVGFELAGFLGILLSVPLSVLIVELIDDLDKKKTLAKSR